MLIPEFPLGFDLCSIDPGARAMLRAIPRSSVRFQPTRLVIPSEIAKNLVVESIEVGGKTLFRGEAPASAFDELHDPEGQKRFVPDWAVVSSASGGAAIVLRNKSKGLAAATATFLGRPQ